MIELPRSLAKALILHAREGKPDEVCGIVGLQGNRIVTLQRARNAAAQPRIHFEIDSRDLIKVIQLEKRELEVGFYHSHPASQAYPSRTDIAHARNWPDALQLMISLRFDQTSGPEIHTYRINGEEVTTLELELVDG